MIVLMTTTHGPSEERFTLFSVNEKTSEKKSCCLPPRSCAWTDQGTELPFPLDHSFFFRPFVLFLHADADEEFLADRVFFTSAFLLCVFCRGVVGGKSNNIKRLSDILDPSVLTPRSVALPFGCMQKTLADPANKACLHRLATDVVELSPSTSSEEAEKILTKAKGIMGGVQLPQSLLQALQECMQEQDEVTRQNIQKAISQTDSAGGTKELESLGSRPSLVDLWNRSGPEKCSEAIKAVWQSLFGLRPWVSLTKAGRKYSELIMAVLVQVRTRRGRREEGEKEER